MFSMFKISGRTFNIFVMLKDNKENCFNLTISLKPPVITCCIDIMLHEWKPKKKNRKIIIIKIIINCSWGLKQVHA